MLDDWRVTPEVADQLLVASDRKAESRSLDPASEVYRSERESGVARERPP